MHTHAAFPIIFPKNSNARRRSPAEIRAAHILQEDYARLLKAIGHVQADRQAAEASFACLCDPKAVDVCIYQIQSAQSEYENLLMQLQEVRQRLENLNLDSAQ